jgi:putative protein kinase ArgK-like GTPase of G3E family
MRIYLASTGPSNETHRKGGMLPIAKRLLSYYHIVTKTLDNDKVFQAIKELKEEQYENQQIGVTGRPGKGEARSRQ